MYFADNWLSTKEQDIEISGDTWCVIHASGPKTIVVEGIDEHGEAKAIQSGENFILRKRLRGFNKLKLHSTQPFGFSIELSEVRGIEPINSDPVYERPIPRNPLAQARERIRQELGIYRETFENETFYPGYEMDDEDEEMFEEDIVEAAKAARSAREAHTEAKDTKEAPTPPNPPNPSPEPPNGVHEQS